MNTHKNILKSVQNAISHYIDEIPESITSEMELKNLNLDSLDIVEIATELEKEYDITIPDHVLETIITVQDFVDVISKRI